MRIAAVIAVLLAAALAGQALAQPADSLAQQLAAKPAKGKDARAALIAAAQQGDPEAQIQLGRAYLTGKGVKGVRKDAVEARVWLSLAAASGRADAAAELARAHEKGIGVAKDDVEAARWWYRAGKFGDEAARQRFLEMFLAGQTDGVGGPEAADWLTARALGGDAAAILGLASIYERGRGVPADPAEARRWYLRLALSGDAEAQYRLGRMLLTAPSRWRAPEDEARDGQWSGPNWMAAKPDTETHAYLGRPGMVPGERWLLTAARRDHAEALFLLASARLGGIDLPFDLPLAVSELEAAAAKGHAGALLRLAELANKGQGYHGKDPVRAWVDYDLATRLGRKDAEMSRDLLAKTMSGRQLSRARQLAQELRDILGM